MKQYDVFISYRRSSYESANLIATRLKAAGYKVFFDLETMRSGPFNKQLYSVIENCKDFILVLPPNALDRCVNEDDWVRKEVLHALEFNKNIVPILLNGFKWPGTMPTGMENLCMYQGVAASIDYFDLAMQRLESYLKSRKKTKKRNFAKWSLASICSLCAFLGIALLMCRFLALPVCKQVVEHLTMQIGIADLLVSDNLLLMDVWDNYPEYYNKEDVRAQMNVVKANIDAYRTTAENVIELSQWQNFLLSLYGTNSENIEMIDIVLLSIYDDIENNMKLINDKISKAYLLPSDRDIVVSSLLIVPYSANTTYYTYLQIINKFPKKSLETYYQLLPMLENMPKTGLGLNNSEYEMFIKQENEIKSQVFDNLEKSISDIKDSTFEQERKLDSLHTAALAEYRTIVSKFEIDENLELGYNWDRILSISSFLNLSIQIRQEALENGEDPGVITPQLVLSDLNVMLEEFQKCHKEAVAYIPSVKAFYNKVVNGYPFGGVLISAFAEGQTHDIYRLGDIIIEWNGISVKTLKELKGEYAKSSSGTLKLLRMENGALNEHTITIPGNEGIVGFSDLVRE